jgi:protein TonB
MRKYSLVFSIAVHSAIVGAAFVTIVATNVLPAPLRSTRFVVVTPPVPSPPLVRPRQPVAPAASPGAAPIVEPAKLEPEVPRPERAVLDGRVDGVPEGAVPGGFGSTAGALPADPPPPPLPRPREPLRVGGVIAPPERLRYVAPVYPELARSARRDGIVILEAVIAEDGSIRDVRVLRSIPLLDQAAVDAVQQWRFTPTRLNGQAIPIVMTVTVSFALN